MFGINKKSNLGRPPQVVIKPPFQFTTYPVYIDAVKQPHLLIAGATGSGKSTVMHALIYTAICINQKSKFVFIDSKGVELWQYTNTPQCAYYASEYRNILSALQYTENVMKARFHDMRNQGLKKTNKAPLYIVIDEYADIVTCSDRTIKAECMRIIQRISQLGRAVSCRLWLATQTPISAILTTAIKCNLDARIGLRTRSKQDSRNIIEQSGLETLPRYGRGYYMTPEYAGYIDIPVIADNEINRLIEYIKK